MPEQGQRLRRWNTSAQPRWGMPTVAANEGASCLIPTGRGRLSFVASQTQRWTGISVRLQRSRTAISSAETESVGRDRGGGSRPIPVIARAMKVTHTQGMLNANIRDVAQDDVPGIAAIYAHHVLHGTATFDIDPPSTGEWGAKVANALNRHWPFVVAEIDLELAGYAYATQFRDRPAYAGTCENSIYVAPNWVGRGVGASLLAALIEKAAAYGFTQMIAVIGGAEPASVALHAKSGFVQAGRMRNVGRKFGKLLDTLYMQRDLRGS